jgi:hypothetical protein
MKKQCSPLDSAQSGDKLSTERHSIVPTAPCETWPPRWKCVVSHTMTTLLLSLRAPCTHWIGGWDSSKDNVAKRKKLCPHDESKLDSTAVQSLA